MADVIATVASISGRAQARNADGELRELKAGDKLREGETVVTPDGGSVELVLFDGSPLTINGLPEMAITRDLVAEIAPGADESAVEDETVQQVIAALESGEDLGEVLPATAAGEDGSSQLDGEGHSWVRLSRIDEFVSEFTGIAGTTAPESNLVIDEDLIPVDAIDDAATTEIDTPVIIDVLPNDQFQLGAIVIGVTDSANGGTVTINDDNTVTYTPKAGFFGTDTFTYTALSADGNGQDTATVTVVIPEPPPVEEEPPTISINNDIVEEGDTATLTITLSKPWDEAVTVQYRSEDDTAVAPGDYDPVTGLVTITFAPGETSQDITFSTNTDDLEEGTEQFLALLSNPTNATIADDTGVVEIRDDFTPPEPPPPPPPPPPRPDPDFEPSVLGSESESDEQFLPTGRSNLPPEQKEENLSRDGSFDVTSRDDLDFITLQPGAIVAGELVVGDPITIVDNGALTGNAVTIGPIEIVFNSIEQNGNVYTISYTASLTGKLEHIETTSGDPADVAGLDTIVVGVEIVVGDEDGDTASAIQSVSIVDDVPDAQLSALGEALNNSGVFEGVFPTLNVDETPGVDLDGDDVAEDTDGPEQSTADFSAFFKNDVTADGEAPDDDVVFGADGPGSVAYALQLKLTGASDDNPTPDGPVASGLYATDPDAADGRGDQIMLTQVGNVIEGNANGQLYFTITDNGDGTITLTQTNALWHADPGDPDDVESLDGLGDQSGYNDGQISFEINLTQTVYDAEGDNDSETVNLTAGLNTGGESGVAYAFNFGDHGPGIEEPGDLLVDEDDLSRGRGDSADGDDSPNTTGTISYDTGLDELREIKLSTSDNATGLVTLGGVAIVTAWDALAGELIGYESGGNQANPADQVFKVALDSTPSGTTGAGTVDYEVTLLKPVQHIAPATEDNQSFTVSVEVIDVDNDIAMSEFDISIDDDLPVLPASQNIQLDPIDTNLLIILDVSGSMDSSSGIPGKNRLEAANEAIETVVDAYDGLGDVKVRLVTFSSNAQEIGDEWVEPEALVLPDNPGGGTDYEDALTAAEGAFPDPGKIEDAQNVSYFFSDGNPNPEDRGINETEEASWVSFLKDNQINSWGFGMGTANGINEEGMDPIAYDGENDIDRDGQRATFEELEEALLDTVFDDVESTLYGAGNSIDDAAGADGAQSLSISLGDDDYVYRVADDEWTLPDSSTVAGSELEITSAAGTWHVNATTGTFSFDPGAGFVAGETASFNYTLTDNDGDGASSGIDIAAPAAKPEEPGQQAPEVALALAADETVVEDTDPLLDNPGALLASEGDDVFAFSLGAEDATIVDFGTSGHDALDLRDLLVGEEAEDADLSAYLNISYNGEDTVIVVSSSGAFADNPVDASTVDQTIILEGIDLLGGNDSATAIQQMKDAGSLITD